MASTFPASVDSFSPQPPVDNFDTVLASDIAQLQNAIIAIQAFLTKSSVSAYYKNVETLSGDKTLTDGDALIQRLDCNGADRTVNVPSGSVSNHAFWIVNSSTGAYNLTIKSNDSVNIYAIVPPNFAGFVVPDGNGKYIATGYGDGVCVDVYKSAAQSIPSGALTKVLVDSVFGNNPYRLFDATNNRIVIPPGLAGNYDIFAWGYLDSHTTAGTLRQLNILHNNNTRAANATPSIASKPTWMQVFLSRYLNAGDALEFHVQQESGVALNLNAARFVVERRR